MKEIFLDVIDNNLGCRLDSFIVSSLKDFTRTQIQLMISEGNVYINNICQKKKNYKLKLFDKVKIVLPKPKPLLIEPEDIPIDIVFEDDDLLVVNKKKGMVVHPAPGNYKGSLVSALLYKLGEHSLSGINGVMRPGIVHRIDKNTSGLLIVAKNDFSHKCLAEMIKNHDFLREYEAVVYGRLKDVNAKIVAPIGRNSHDRKKMAVTYKNSKEAVTCYTLIKTYTCKNGMVFSHVRLRLETGRTHQIRVHMSYIGHPVAGDDVYGPKKVIKELCGQCLHAKTIGFVHPRTKQFMKVESELPDYFKSFLLKLERESV